MAVPFVPFPASPASASGCHYIAVRGATIEMPECSDLAITSHPVVWPSDWKTVFRPLAAAACLPVVAARSPAVCSRSVASAPDPGLPDADPRPSTAPCPAGRQYLMRENSCVIFVRETSKWMSPRYIL